MNRRVELLTKVTAAFLVTAVLFVAPAGAEIIGDTIFEITAEAPDGSLASFDVDFTSGHIDGDTLTWALTEPVQLLDDNENLLGTLEQANILYVADPVISLNFLVTSGAGGANFTINSAPLTFPTLDKAIGRASAGLTVQDNSGNGAFLNGNFANNLTYGAFYNGVATGTGSAFAMLTPGVSSSSPFVQLISDGFFPDNVGGFSAVDQSNNVLQPVSQMSAQWKFSVGALDSAGGTSQYVIIIPEPGSCLLGLLGMISLAILRRR